MYLLETTINKMFYRFKDILPNRIIKKLLNLKLPYIDRDSTLGEQIKYYRMSANLNQNELAIKIGCTKYSIQHLENKEIKLLDVNLVKCIIKELEIEDKIRIKDEYILFLLNNPKEKIIEARKSLKLTQNRFAEIVGCSIATVKRWENGNTRISKDKYMQLKKCMS